IDKLLDKNLQFIVYALGKSEINPKLEQLQAKYPEKFKFVNTHDEYFYHKMMAGADLLISSSQQKVDCLNIMYAATYGTVPLVRVTDTVDEIFEEWDGEDGFALKIEGDTDKDLFSSIEDALKLFDENKEDFELIQKNGTYEEFGWAENAQKYEDIYKKLLK
ncbi:hypothetical protein OAQ99_00690, partial [Candidatus Kapabacteria bacterium]|nr:hypothetical protein [Candidatus Kapabacteria bacterium]